MSGSRSRIKGEIRRSGDNENDNDPNWESLAAVAATVSTFPLFFSDGTDDDDAVLGWGIKGRGDVVSNAIVVNSTCDPLSSEAGPFLDDNNGGGNGSVPIGRVIIVRGGGGGGRNRGTEEGGQGRGPGILHHLRKGHEIEGGEGG